MSSGLLALHTTFRGSAEEKASAVSFWGFRAPLGAWVCVLGCGAMLASAPFDDWWHDAYGLDVRIVSPPHIVLGGGNQASGVSWGGNPAPSSGGRGAARARRADGSFWSGRRRPRGPEGGSSDWR